MTIRQRILDLIAAGPLPDSSIATEADLDARSKIIEEIQPPLTNEEAAVILELIGPDECFGLAWSLLHLIETAPELPRAPRHLLARSEWLRSTWIGPQETGLHDGDN